MENQDLKEINIHILLEKCKSKKEIYRFLNQDCKAYLPKISSTNIYFFKQIIQGQKEYLNREDVKISSAPHIEGLTVHDFQDYIRRQPQIIKYMPEERDWLHLDRQWICNIIYSLDTENFQKFIDNAIQQRQKKLEQQQNLTIQMRPEFLQALNECKQFSCEKGKSVFLIKNTSKRKRTKEELEEVKNEEDELKEDKQQYLKEHKRLKIYNQDLLTQIQIQNNQMQAVKQLMEAGILNENGQLIIQQQFDI